MIRLHVEPALTAGATIEATGGQAHYLVGVMRLAVGDTIRIFNGRDGEWAARITTLSRGKATFVAETLSRPQSDDADLWLIFAVLKRDTTDMLVQKATELGVSMLLPVFTERTNAGRVNLDRLRSIAIEAAEQSERLTIPALRPARQLHDVLKEWSASRPLFVALERADAQGLAPSALAPSALAPSALAPSALAPSALAPSALAPLALTPSPGPAGLLIGPEGGFGPRDHTVLGRCRFVRAVSLGPRILRAETAAIVGLALLQAQGCG